MKKLNLLNLIALIILAVILLPILHADAQQVKREVMTLTDIPTGTNAAETADSDNINGILERLFIDITGTGTQSVSVVTEDGLVLYTNATISADASVYPQVSATTAAGVTITGIYTKVAIVGKLTTRSSAGNATNVDVKVSAYISPEN